MDQHGGVFIRLPSLRADGAGQEEGVDRLAREGGNVSSPLNSGWCQFLCLCGIHPTVPTRYGMIGNRRTEKAAVSFITGF